MGVAPSPEKPRAVAASPPPAELRVGVAMSSWVVPAWGDGVLAELAGLPFVTVAAWILDDADRPPSTLGASRLRAGSPAPLFRLYERADRLLFTRPGDAFAPVDARSRRGGAPTLAPDRLAAADLDVLVALDFRDAERLPARSARYGVWSVHHGGESGPALFSELYEQRAISESVLEARTADASWTICRIRSPTDDVSLQRLRNRLFWKSARFFARRLRDLSAYGWEGVLAVHGEPSPPRDRAPGAPSPFRLGVHAARTAGRFVKRRGGAALGASDWRVAYRHRTPGGPALPGGSGGFRILEPPPGRFYADPFLFERDGRHLLFLEDFDHATNRGRIAMTELTPGEVAPPTPVLERDYHLSYPFVFASDGDVFMLPETAAAGEVQLFRAVEFPHRWELAQVLLSGLRTYDSTLVRHAGRFWLFTSVVGEDGAAGDELSSWDELFLFSAPALSGPWAPHPANPVVTDARRARPAGRVFERGGRLIRPAQDCSGGYGQAVALNEIVLMTPERYREVEVDRIEPALLPEATAVHTYNADDDYEVVDLIPRFGLGAARRGIVGREALRR